jgi:hypothetical protein
VSLEPASTQQGESTPDGDAVSETGDRAAGNRVTFSVTAIQRPPMPSITDESSSDSATIESIREGGDDSSDDDSNILESTRL